MSRFIKTHPWKSVLIVACLALGCVSFFLYKPDHSSEADTSGPASVVDGNINAPQSGGTVYVSGYVNGTNAGNPSCGSVGSGMTVWGRSVTRDNLINGGTAQWYLLSYVPNAPGASGSYYGNVQAAYGDLIEVKATNWYYNMCHTSTKQIGYVPAGTDTAPPEFNQYYITIYGGSSTTSVSINAYYGVYDPSYPITVTLYDCENIANKATIVLTSTTYYPQSLYLNISSSISKKVRMYARDNYGNGRSMFYIANQLGSQAANDWNNEPSLSDGERTGNQAVGGIGVQLHNGSFLDSKDVFEIRGRMLNIPVTATYRSLLTHDGCMGRSWDSILKSHLYFSGNHPWWYPGNGREEKFQYVQSADYYATPPGLFVRFTKDPNVVGVYYITFKDGTQWTYQNNCLTKIQDTHGNVVVFTRDSSGKAFRITDDLGRLYNISYFNHGRIAEIEEYTGEKTQLEYNSVGNLTGIIDKAGYRRRFEYQSFSPYMLTKEYDRNDRAVLENVYYTSGTYVKKVQRQNRPAGAATGYVFNYDFFSGLGLVSVTDPRGTITKYFIDNSNPLASTFLLIAVRTCANQALRTSIANYDWSLVPNWVEQKYSYEPSNHMLAKSWIEWCPGDVGTDCAESGVEKTPYTWYDYNTGIQNEATIDPRGFGNLRLVRRDKEVGDDDRNGECLRESWEYEANFNRQSAHWETRAWRNAPLAMDSQDPSTWQIDDAYKTTYNYNAANGDLDQIVHPAVTFPESKPAAIDSFTYNTYGQMLTSAEPYDATDPDDVAVVHRYVYYSSGLWKGMLQKKWIDVPGTSNDPSESYEYDASGNMTARIDGKGNRFLSTYDGLGRLLTTLDPYVSSGAHTATYVYDGDDLVETRFPNKKSNGSTPAGEPSELRITYEYRPDIGELNKETRDLQSSGNPASPIRAEKIYSYDVMFNVVRVQDQFSASAYRVNDAVFDEFNRRIRGICYLSAASDPYLGDDAISDSYFNELGKVIRSIDPNGLATTFEFDSIGRQTSTVNPNGIRDVIEYQDKPEVDPTLPMPKPTVRHYSEVTDSFPSVGISRTDEFTNECGNTFLRRIYYDLSASAQFYELWNNYYLAGRIKRSYDQFTGHGPTYYHYMRYDAAGRLSIYKAPKNAEGAEAHIDTYNYDANNNVSLKTVTEWDGGSTPSGWKTPYSIAYAFDNLNRVTTMTQGGEISRNYYDSFGRCVSNTFSSLGIETKHTFDLDGNEIKTEEKVSANPLVWRVTEKTYDYLGRVTSKSTPNPTGDLLNPQVTTTYEYDAFGQGQLAMVILPSVGGASDTYEYTYDLGGRLVEKTDPNGTVTQNIYVPVSANIDHKNVFYSGYPGPVPESFGGPYGYYAVSYKYTGLQPGCSCSGGLQATEISTRQGGVDLPVPNGTLQTKVTREFDPLGRVIAESVCAAPFDVNGECTGGNQYSTAYSYDYEFGQPGGLQNYAETFTFPDGKSTMQVYDTNARVVETWTNLFGSNSQIVAEYKYQGGDKISRRRYQSNGYNTAEQVVTYDAAGWGNRMGNTWTQNGTQSVAVWDADYDAANRPHLKLEGSPGGVRQSVFEYNLKGELTHADFYSPNVPNPPPAPGPAYQAVDWSAQDYSRDSAGNVNGLTEYFMPGSGSEQQEPVGYVLQRDEHGDVTGVTGEHVFTYYDRTSQALDTVRSKMGQQNRALDANGNTITLDVNYSIADDQLDNDGCDPLCSCNQQRNVDYSWSFKYDAWDRVVQAQEYVAIHDFYSCDPGEYLYTVTHDWRYDGLGRRVTNSIVSLDADSKAPEPFSGGQSYNTMEVHGDDGEIVQSFGNRYVIDAAGGPAVASASALGSDPGVPQYYIRDILGNAGILLSGEGDSAGEKETTPCGDEHPKQTSMHPSAFRFNLYGNSYGYYQEGMRAVDDRNCTPFVLTADGRVEDREVKDCKGAGDTGPPLVVEGDCPIHLRSRGKDHYHLARSVKRMNVHILRAGMEVQNPKGAQKIKEQLAFAEDVYKNVCIKLFPYQSDFKREEEAEFLVVSHATGGRGGSLEGLPVGGGAIIPFSRQEENLRSLIQEKYGSGGRRGYTVVFVPRFLSATDNAGGFSGEYKGRTGAYTMKLDTPDERVFHSYSVVPLDYKGDKYKSATAHEIGHGLLYSEGDRDHRPVDDDTENVMHWKLVDPPSMFFNITQNRLLRRNVTKYQ